MKNINNCGILFIYAVLILLWGHDIFTQDEEDADIALTDYWYGGDYIPTSDTSMDWNTFLEFEPNRSNIINPHDFCTGVQCNLSAFDDNQKLELYRRANMVTREQFVHGNNSWKSLNLNIHSESFSNIFHAVWDEEIATYAQQKAALCLVTDPTRGHIHKGPLQSSWNRYPERYPIDSHCKVLATSDSFAIEQYARNRLSIPTKVHYSYVLSNHTVTPTTNETRLLYRGLASYAFGCGIVVRKNETHYMEHVVCYHCPAILLNSMIRKYLPRNGTPCTGCRGYYGLDDIQCTSEVDPPLAKAYGLKFRGLCFTDIVPTRKFIETLYTEEECPTSENENDKPSTKTTKSMTTLTLSTIKTTEVSTGESEDQETFVMKLSCNIYVHIFTAALTLGFIVFSSLFIRKTHKDKASEADEKDDYDENEE